MLLYKHVIVEHKMLRRKFFYNNNMHNTITKNIININCSGHLWNGWQTCDL